MITPIREAPLYQFIDYKTTELGGSLHAIGGIADHVHVIVSSPPSLALSEYVKAIKGSSSRYLNANYPNPSAKFKWQQEYGVFSISPKSLDRAIAYAQTQKHHHAHGTTFPHVEPDAIFTRPSP